MDIQSAKQQREAVHAATAQVIDELAEEKMKNKEDDMTRTILWLEEEKKKAFLSMYNGIGKEVDDWLVKA